MVSRVRKIAPTRRQRLAALLSAFALFGSACSGAGSGAGAASTPGPPGGAVESGLVAAPVDVPGGVAFGLKWEWNRLPAYQEHLGAITGGSTFAELVWCNVEPEPGLRDWSTIDDMVDRAGALGYRMHLKIRVGSCWATGERLEERGRRRKTASLLPLDMTAYRSFVAEAVRRYSPAGVRQWAVENEVNEPDFWAASPADYERLAREASAVIREADPGAMVFDSGLSSTAHGFGIARWLLDQGRPDDAVAAYQRYFDRRFSVRPLPRVSDEDDLRRALAGEKGERNLSFSDATFRLAQDVVVDGYQLHFYERWDNAALLVDYLRSALPSAFPIEAWEAGIFWPGGGDNEHVLAAETAKVTASLLGSGVADVIWLPTSFDPDGIRSDEIRWGLFESSGQPRAAWPAWVGLAGAATGLTQARRVQVGNVEGAALSDGGRSVLVLWSEEPQRVAAAAPPGARATDLAGATVPWTAEGLRLSSAPVIIAMDGPPEPVLALLRSG